MPKFRRLGLPIHFILQAKDSGSMGQENFSPAQLECHSALSFFLLNSSVVFSSLGRKKTEKKEGLKSESQSGENSHTPRSVRTQAAARRLGKMSRLTCERRSPPRRAVWTHELQLLCAAVRAFLLQRGEHEWRLPAA